MYVDDWLVRLRVFEGCSQYMYLDTNGHVTVGVGRMLSTANEASGLPFGVAGRAATHSEIVSDYARVTLMERGLEAKAYRCKTSPVLDNGSIDAMLFAKVDGFDAALKKGLPGYVAAPDPAKIALLDMAYELGVSGLVFGYRHELVPAVAAGDFVKAAASCHRIGPSEERNSWTVAQFEASAQMVAAARAVN